MGRRALWAIVVALLACAASPAGASAANGFLAGAAKIDITPPKFDPAHDEPEFASCPPGMTGKRIWRFEEPYTDVNGNGAFDYGDPANGVPPEPFCDANGNGRRDAIYSSGAVNSPLRTVHDPIDARAIAISDGSHAYVVESVTAQGLFQNYIDLARIDAQKRRPIADVVVSANHNEGSPDTIGIYGGPSPDIPVTGNPIPAGARSGIDEYYMTWLEDRMASVAASAYDDMRPATLWARQFPTPPTVSVDLSKNFPTTYDQDLPGGEPNPAAIDPKIGVLQARDSHGTPIATVLSLAAHNQRTGQKNPTAMSADWPGYFHNRLESLLGHGTAMFLVGDNGSEEDPDTVPKTPTPDAAAHYTRAQATGERFAAAVAADSTKLLQLPYGQIAFERRTLDVPIENNVFKAAAAAGLFGQRQTYTAGSPAGPAGQDVRTYASVLGIGPALQLISNPGEAFPALMLGSPFGIDDASCPNRPNPAVPTWRARAAIRLQIGLSDDMIGYELPPWAYLAGTPGAFTTDQCDAQSAAAGGNDPKGHRHKLEEEGVGPTASAMVADTLAAILAKNPDPTAAIGPGRFVRADGTVQKRPEGAVAIWLPPTGSTTLTAGKGTLIAIAGVTGFGGQAIDGSARMMDYDGLDQPAGSDITTRGAIQFACDGSVARRLYVDVYPALAAPAKIAPATKGSLSVGCGAGLPGVGAPGGPDSPLLVGPGGGPAGPGVVPASCHDKRRPSSKLARRRVRLRRGHVSVRGRSRDRGCAKLGAVLVSVGRPVGHHRCRYLQANGRLGPALPCRKPFLLRATGTRKWLLATRAKLPPGTYRVLVRAVDRRGNREKPSRRNHLRLRVR